MIRLLHCLIGGKEAFLSAWARFDTAVLMQSDDKYATITAVLARLTLAYHDPAWAIRITGMRNPSLFRTVTTSTTVTMEKDPIMLGRDSSEITWEGCYKCHERKAQNKLLKYLVGILLIHLLIQWTTIALQIHLLNLSKTSARKHSNSTSRYCG